MKKIFTTILFVILNLMVGVPSAFAISSFDLGGIHNPINVQVEYSQSTLNQQKENSLKSSYGLSNYYSCASGESSLDLSNPSTMARHLNSVQYCLERKALSAQRSEATSSCQQGYVVKNGVCVTPDAGCKATYGQSSRFDKYDATTGYPICGCSAGYEFSSDGKSCVSTQSRSVESGISADVLSEATCMLRQNAQWNKTTKSCACPSGYAEKEIGGDCFVKKVDQPVKTNDQICQDKWKNTVWNEKRNDCDCATGYNWNGSSCVVVPVKTNDQICQEWRKNTKWAGTKNDQGGLVCECKTDYQLNQDQTQCTTAPKKETTKVASLNGGLQSNTVADTPRYPKDEQRFIDGWNKKNVPLDSEEVKPKSLWSKVKTWFGF
ncbi:MAG: hypothetical protein WBC83_03370 [Minisyncoccia bacterium]